jgi:hypothetical protein
MMMNVAKNNKKMLLSGTGISRVFRISFCLLIVNLFLKIGGIPVVFPVNWLWEAWKTKIRENRFGLKWGSRQKNLSNRWKTYIC